LLSGDDAAGRGQQEAFIHADYRWWWIRRSPETAGRKHMLVVSAMGANPHSPFFYNR
jgi:uncharacterized protein YbjT (DUF2867 family)